MKPAARALRPRKLVHRGVVSAAAVLLDTALLGPEETRRRAVALWAPGCAVYRVGAGLLVRFAAPRRIDCSRAPGLSLVGAGGALLSAPLDPDELRALGLGAGDVVTVRGGRIVVERPGDADLEDPATFLDVSGFEIVSATPLGKPPRAAIVVAPPEAPEAREALGIAPPPPELTRVLAALRARAGARSPPSGASGTGAGVGAALPLLGSFLAGVAAVLSWFAPRGAARPASGGAPVGQRRALSVTPQAPSGPSLADRMSVALRHWLAAFLIKARLAGFLGRQQAGYMSRMMEMFRRGDLSEALRHAIPLGGKGGLAAQSFGLPSPRADLTIRGRSSGVGAAIFTDSDLFADLTRMYRNAFERLEREGRIDEAAFVLAELLHASEEAVAFLERHGRLRLAAEIAEARDLSPALVVRQWFLAGDKDRAVRLSRRHGVFADAVAALEKSGKPSALRVLWAEELAEQGDFARAAEVIWPVADARPLAAAWLDHGIAQGGAAAARLLPKKLALMPEAFEEMRAAALSLLQRETAVERGELARALLATPKTSSHATLARPVLRALVKDASERDVDPQLVAKLASYAGDRALSADLPPTAVVARTLLRQRSTMRTYALSAADAGTMAARDAALLPSGRVLVALGEAGVRVLTRDGRIAGRFDQPADRLVVGDHGTRAIALAARGDRTFRLSRLDLVGMRSEAWCEARIDAWASSFDGSLWVAASGKDLLLLDALSDRFEALHRVAPGGRPMAVGRTPSLCATVARTRLARGGVEIWRYHHELPSWTLRRSDKLVSLSDASEVLYAAAGERGVALVAEWAPSAPRKGVWGADAETRARSVSWYAPKAGRSQLNVGAADEPPRSLEVAGDFIACAARGSTGLRVFVATAESGLRLLPLELTLGGATDATLRIQGDVLVVADDRGRLLAVDLVYGDLLRNLRI